MRTVNLIALVLPTAGAAAIVLGPALWAYVTFRAKRVVICPETRKPVGVDVNASLAAFTGSFGKPVLRLRDCTRWPQRRDCGQECVAQIELAPEDCIVRGILGKWYEGRNCVYCGRRFQRVQWSEHRPALLTLDRKMVEWKDVRPEDLFEVLASHRPVCWNCLIVETFRREHPELVVEAFVRKAKKRQA